ncbi:16S rRNA (uracil(1498)-N(3))-methyltransferase [Pseudoxanthomonas yeongjuensis]|uniref:16S rRNA (uracil(1498)-N(3))-methyltransferase n=1 Tax=Pseudoxanthomonas yeongjuensis TaxID=377616 RepID=UPI001390C4F5|nr:16S rRNA (uracil(1498)-N(3))-methyltransferase [Pseudoxanthomonas yeongjuensis]KAF1715178.1 16S rRNA (uracil(1498)-N(3))-methyltransferase [Pseudoxanthomonas yeongjuensis]
MRLTRCHVDTALSPGVEITLPESAAAHLVRVLRLREGDECVLFNGDGDDYRARIASAGKREVVAQVLSASPVDNESPLRITLVQGIARGEKMDLILQKATELGVAGFVPVLAERTEVRLDAERTEKRMTHWRSVIVSACEQSGRARVPELMQPIQLGQVAAQVADDAVKLTLDPVGDSALATLATPAARLLTIAIGPEGGWSPRDREILRAAGFSGLRLGPRILRTETAGLAAIAALQSRFGDM